MQNSKSFNKITIDTGKAPREKFGMLHDVNTTASIGDTQPLTCLECIPKSKTTLSMRHLIRLAPMVAPTYGRMKAKCWTHFVGLSDLLPRSYPAMLAKAPISKGSINSVPTVPTETPNMNLADLSAMCLFGAQFTVYFHDPSGIELPDDSLTYWRSYDQNATDTAVTDFDAWITPLLSIGTSAMLPGYNGAFMQLNVLGAQFGTGNASIPVGLLGTTVASSLFRRFLYPTTGLTPNPFSWESVDLNSADYVFRTSFTNGSNTYDICFACRLSAFGKRIRKILTGLGYQVNFSASGVQVDVTPVFAYYKAYWDTFGLTLYDNWESSVACQLLSAYDAQEAGSSVIFDWSNPLFTRFTYDLGTTFVTETQDYISAHQVSDAVAPSVNAGGYDVDKNRGWLNNIVLDTPSGLAGAGVNGIGESNGSGYGTPPSTNTYHVYINRLQHTEVDAELLKTLYKWTNRQTIAGKRIKELLEAGGYGDYVKNCKTNFVGYEELDIDVTDVNATADSTNSATGANSQLGEYVGKGVGVTQGDAKTVSFENDEAGYLITLFAITPEAGWCQGLDARLLNYDADHKYTREFDGKGMQLQPKSVVFGGADWNKAQYSSDFSASFGMVPRHSCYKVKLNIANGDFTLRSARDSYLPFILDKYLSFGDRGCTLVTSATHRYAVQKLIDVSNIPVAGNAWRYLNRYAWLSNFERIFAQSDSNLELFLSTVRSMGNLTKFELCHSMSDHFICMNVMDLVTYAPMLPVADSYGTTDDNDGHGDTMFTKA